MSTAQLLRVLTFAATKHRDQRRKDVDASPYINHPIAVATVLAMEGRIDDVRLLMGAVLHDTVEDTQTTFEELAQLFGSGVAELVREVTDDKALAYFHLSRMCFWESRLQFSLRRVIDAGPAPLSSPRSRACTVSLSQCCGDRHRRARPATFLALLVAFLTRRSVIFDIKDGGNEKLSAFER